MWLQSNHALNGSDFLPRMDIAPVTVSVRVLGVEAFFLNAEPCESRSVLAAAPEACAGGCGAFWGLFCGPGVGGCFCWGFLAITTMPPVMQMLCAT